jgi:hypothetical protein
MMQPSDWCATSTSAAKNEVELNRAYCFRKRLLHMVSKSASFCMFWCHKCWHSITTSGRKRQITYCTPMVFDDKENVETNRAYYLRRRLLTAAQDEIKKSHDT